MIHNLSITLLVDNTLYDPQLQCEHGLSIWIEADNHRIVFDTGQSDILIQNAQALDNDLRSADILIFSHGHYDHTGGTDAFLEVNRNARLFFHPGALIPRYSRQADGSIKSVGITMQTAKALDRAADTINWTSSPTMLSPDIGITGFIPRVSPFEDTGGAFFLDLKAKRSDAINDDQALWFATAKGIVVVTGCCHSGLVNTLEYIKKLTAPAPLHALIGGLHLLNASAQRLEMSCEYLLTSGIELIVPCHCSGEKATEYLQARLDKRVEPAGAGRHIEPLTC